MSPENGRTTTPWRLQIFAANGSTMDRPSRFATIA